MDSEGKYSEFHEDLLQIIEACEKEDSYAREQMIREAKQYELYWHGFQYVFWDASKQDYRIPTHETLDQLSSREDLRYAYEYVVNIFKAHGLSIIAALSAEVPGVPFSPLDAESVEDVRAAKKAEEVGKIIAKTNKAKLLFYHALYTLYTSHFCAAYNYYERDKKWGTYQIDSYGERQIETPAKSVCEGCGYATTGKLDNCPDCGAEMDYTPPGTETQLSVVGEEEIIRGMEKIRLRGVLNVKIPIYAAEQTAIGYLLEYDEQHYAFLRNLYPHIDRAKLGPGQSDQQDERRLRLQASYAEHGDDYSSDMLTVKRCWARPWMFEILEESRAKALKEAFSDGVFIAAVDRTVCDVSGENLDDSWTLTKGDLSRTLHADPIGKPLIDLQDMENTVVNLLTESLEHSIPSTFADPEVLDFDLYSSQEAAPGAVYPIKAPLIGQKRLEEYFYTLKAASLPQEGAEFDKIVEAKGQFVVGAFPSIFGGPQKEGSKTLGEYQESRSYALQRLSIPYQLLYFWWAEVIHKCVIEYIGMMVDDEVHVKQGTDGRFQNITFLMSDFQKGKFNMIIPESAVDLPVSYSQKRGTLEQIIQLNSDILNSFLFSPENRRITLRYLGIEELSDYESNQTFKQLTEIDQIIRLREAAVPIEEEVDDHEIHLRVIRNFAASDAGQELKKLDPESYVNILMHGKLHMESLAAVLPAEPVETENA